MLTPTQSYNLVVYGTIALTAISIGVVLYVLVRSGRNRKKSKIKATQLRNHWGEWGDWHPNEGL